MNYFVDSFHKKYGRFFVYVHDLDIIWINFIFSFFLTLTDFHTPIHIFTFTYIIHFNKPRPLVSMDKKMHFIKAC